MELLSTDEGSKRDAAGSTVHSWQSWEGDGCLKREEVGSTVH